MGSEMCIRDSSYSDHTDEWRKLFNYCNDEMAVVEGVHVADMINRSFYKVFENGDKKWLVTYADVALNGTKRIIHDYSPEINKNLTIHCFQPSPGYCACVLIPTD